MTRDKDKSDRAAESRRLAEERLRERKPQTTRPGAEQDTLRLLHELQVHQIELEMQNQELIQARAEVETALERYTDLYDFAPVGYFALDSDGTIRQANIMGAKLLGLERARLVRRGLGGFVAPDDSSRWGEYLRGVEQSDAKQTCELRFKRSDGATFWAHLESVRLARPGREAADDDPDSTIRVAMSDISDRKRAEDAVREAGERLKEVVRLAPAFMCILRGREHVFEVCNDKYLDVVGRRDILNVPIRQALPELKGQGFFELLDGVFKTGEPYAGKEVSVRLQRTPGEALEEVLIDFVYLPLREADGSVSGIFVHGVDITEQVLSRRQIESLAADLEKRVQERTEELARTVTDLKAEVRDRLSAEESARQSARLAEGRLAELERMYAERKRIEERILTTNRFLALSARETTRESYLISVPALTQEAAGCCRCAGIRLRDDAGGIPYEVSSGFSPEFLESESRLRLGSDECACTRIITGQPLPCDAQAMTEAGSFFCNDTSLLAQPDGGGETLVPRALHRERFRIHCRRAPALQGVGAGIDPTGG